MKTKIIIVCSLFLLTSWVKGSTNSVTSIENSTRTLIRDKRFLIFNYGGQVRFVGGYLGPIDTPTWTNINCARNFQFQFNLPPKVITIYNKFNRNLGNGRTLEGDSSRMFAYKIAERLMSKSGDNGHACLLKAICEAAYSPLDHNGLVGQLLQLFLTPGPHERIDNEYRYANEAGRHGVDCTKIYPECPLGQGALDSITMLQTFKLDNIIKTLI